MSWNYLAIRTNYWCNRNLFNLQDQRITIEMAILGADRVKEIFSIRLHFMAPPPTKKGINMFRR